MDRRVLLLSATTGYQLRSFNDAAERLGIRLSFATDRCHTLEDPWRDSAVPVRFHEQDDSLRAIVNAARDRPIDGVVAVGDRPVVLAARVAGALGLPGNPPAAAAASANKLLMRERFAAAGLSAPWFLRLDPDPHRPQEVRFPCVVKPLGLSGSRGVIRADSPSELAGALARVRSLLARRDVRALRTGTEGEILVEGYVDGREYAIEGVLTNGSLQVFAIFDKPDPLDGPFFEETIYVAPSRLPPELQRQISREVARAAGALGLRHGPIHAECRVGSGSEGSEHSERSEVVVIEVAARPIGGLCSKALRFEGDVSLEEVVLRHAVGEDITAFRREPGGSAVMMIPIPKRGLFKRVEGEDDARRVSGVYEVRITAKSDQLLEPLPEAGSYLGFIFARASTAAEAECAVREAHRRLTFGIERDIAVR